MQSDSSIPAVNLDNCDREPIHVPGHIQDHGALLVFDAQGRLARESANAREMLGVGLPEAGEPLRQAHFGGDAVVHEALRAAIDTRRPSPARRCATSVHSPAATST
jgi:light-regulated signal transduction histidine kinase (bacteriophytochrome)